MSVRFAGYAAVFDWPDRGGDVVRAGAFRRALARASEVPLLWQHKGAAIGRIEHLSEDRRGLRVIARIADARVGELVRRGLRGLLRVSDQDTQAQRRAETEKSSHQ